MNRRIHGIKDWVGAARSANYNVEALAKLCDCSIRRLQRHFEQCQCKPPQAWLMEVRLWDSVRFLTEGRDPKEISLDCGFKDLCHFYRRFKRYHGCTPLEYLSIRRQRNAASLQRLLEVFPDSDFSPVELAPLPEDARALAILNRGPMCTESPALKSDCISSARRRVRVNAG
ncbi:MAG: AraC family transcriptional regulator [Verrucomicrobia bacterium]|jgi:AraC-like DNA-binding protein|nr:AraC family transcriptional regulator [Verrucomicrobiota bacterium]